MYIFSTIFASSVTLIIGSKFLKKSSGIGVGPCLRISTFFVNGDDFPAVCTLPTTESSIADIARWLTLIRKIVGREALKQNGRIGPPGRPGPSLSQSQRTQWDIVFEDVIWIFREDVFALSVFGSLIWRTPLSKVASTFCVSTSSGSEITRRN